MNTLYRIRQLYAALRARLTLEDRALVARALTPAELALFERMPRYDQRHCLDVYRLLVGSGYADPLLLRAALLHDCGKGAVPVWVRILYVLRPSLIDGIARENAPGYRGAAWRLRHHEAIGARAALAAGCSETTMRFIEGRPLPEEQALFDALVAADDAS